MEHYTERNCRMLAEARGFLLIKMSPVGVAGIPDRVLLLTGGRVVFIEFKAVGKYPTPIQRWWHERLRKLGFRVEVHRSSAEFRALVDELKNV